MSSSSFCLHQCRLARASSESTLGINFASISFKVMLWSRVGCPGATILIMRTILMCFWASHVMATLSSSRALAWLHLFMRTYPSNLFHQFCQSSKLVDENSGTFLPVRSMASGSAALTATATAAMVSRDRFRGDPVGAAGFGMACAI